MFSKRWLIDTAERALATGVQTFLAQLVVADLSTAEGAALAAVGAVMSVIKAAIATRIGSADSASLVA